jgi:hypothetical protein
MLAILKDSLDQPCPKDIPKAVRRQCKDTRGKNHHYWCINYNSPDDLDALHRQVGFGRFSARIRRVLCAELEKKGLQLYR